MRRASVLRILRVSCVCALLGLGCATASSQTPSCPEGFQAAAQARGIQVSCDVLRDPGRLVEEARAAYDVGDYVKGYQEFALIHELHPESPENRQVFRLAARLFVGFVRLHRIEPKSIWLTSEPRFMFGWFEQFVREGKDFPQEQATALFRGLDYGMFREYLAFAKTRPDLSAWQISVEKDDGIIEAVSGRRIGPSSARTEQRVGSASRPPTP